MELQITEGTFQVSDFWHFHLFLCSIFVWVTDFLLRQLQNGKAVLSCVAKLFNLYRGERKETIEEAKPRPRPSSVLGPRNDSSGIILVLI